MMIFFVPPLAVIYGRYLVRCETWQLRKCPSTPLAASERQVSLTALGPFFEAFAAKCLVHPRLKFVWVAVLLVASLGTGSQFVSPGLAYPKSADMQMLISSSPFERFCCAAPAVKSEFVLGSTGVGRRRIALVWGVTPRDNGNQWDPRSYPTAVLRSGFDPTSKAAQAWLYELCVKARESQWWGVDPTEIKFNGFPFFPHNCSIEVVRHWMELPCTWKQSASAKCCDRAWHAFPFEPSEWEFCLGEYAERKYKQSREARHVDFVPQSGLNADELMTRGVGTFFDSSGDHKPRVFTMAFSTRFKYTQGYQPTKGFIDEVEGWAGKELASAPPELSGGYLSFPSRSLDFFSLQVALGDSCFTSMYIAIGVGCIVLTLVAGNIIIALFTTLTVALIMATVAGILVSIGWELGIMESIIISCGIGMACDFAAHLGFAYRQVQCNSLSHDTHCLTASPPRKS